MKKRLLSVCLCLALLLGLIAATGILPTWAVSAGWTAGDGGVGQYKTFAQYDNAYLTGLGTSLVKGVIPYYGTGGSLWSSSSYQSSSATNGADRLTDGAIRTSKDDTTTDKFTSTHRGKSTTRYFTFDLGEDYDLTDFVAASSQTDSGENLLRWVKVYVGDSKDTLYTTESNLVYSRWDLDVDATNCNFHIQPADGAMVTGRYVGFALQTPTNGLYRIEELAVYGVKHVDAPAEPPVDPPVDPPAEGWTAGDDGVGQYKTFAQYDNAYLTALGTSVVKGVIPFYGTGNSLWSSSSYQSSSAANGADKLTDGAIRSSSSDTTTDKFTSTHRGEKATRYFTFDLGKKYDLTDFVAASSQNDSGDNLLRWVKVYVGNDKETLYTTESNLVYSRWDQAVDATNRNFHIQPAGGATVTGQYVGFALQTPSNGLFRIEELAVYGTEYVIPPKQPDADGVIPWEGGDVIDTENNLLKNAAADTNCSAYVSNANPDWNTVMTNVTDGDTATEGKLYSWHHEENFAEIKVGDTTLTGTSGIASMAFSLGGTYSIEKLLLIGNPSASTNAIWSYSTEDGAKKYWGEGYYALKPSDNKYHPTYADGTFRTFNDKVLQYYEVYVSTSAATLFDETNCVWAYTNKNQYVGTTYTLPTAAVGSYIGYRITTGSGGNGQSHIGELGVYGTAVEDTKIVMVGDSITHGANLAEGRYFKNHPAMLSYLLNEDAAKPYSVYNAGISGSAVVNYQLVDAATEKDASWLTLGTAAGHVRYADILTVMLGTNDANSWASRKDLFKQEYTKIVDAFKALNPNVQVYIATSPYTSTFSEDVLEEIAALQKELAQELGATLIDVYEATASRVEEKGSNSLFVSGDLLHPHEKGQAFLSTLFYKAITGKDADLDLGDDEGGNTTPWKEGVLVKEDGVPVGNLLKDATVDTAVSSNANPNWTAAKEGLANEDNTDTGVLYAKESETGYPEAKHPVTGNAVKGTTGWAQVMFQLDGYYAIDRLLFYGQSTGNSGAKWSYESEDSAKKYWGENYTLSGGRYYCAYAPNGEIRSFNDRTPQYVEVYISDYPGMLFDSESLVWAYDNTADQSLGYGITLSEAVKGQYVGIRVTTGSTFQARLGELAVYGETAQRDYNGTIPWNVGDALPENNLLADATRQRDDALGNALASNLGIGAPENVADGSADSKACYYNYDEDSDKYYAEAINPVTGDAITGTSGWARIAFKLQKYTAVEKFMLVGSVGDKPVTQWNYATESSARDKFGDNYVLHTDGKYYAAYADGTIREFNNRQALYYELYVADDFNSLFDAANLVYSFDNSKMLLDGAVHELDEAAEGRYVGIRTTAGTNSQVRIGEIGVYGYTVEKDITLSKDTPVGKITYTIAANNTPDRLALMERVGSLEVTVETLSEDVPKNIENNWLTVDGTAVYRVQLLDKQGNVFPNVSDDPVGGLNGRPVQIAIPTAATYMQTLGTLDDGTIRRVFNSQKTLDGQVLAGTLEYPDYGSDVPNNREKAVISTSDLRLVMLRFNDLNTINKLNGAVVNTPLSEFRPDDVAGTTATALPALPIAVAALCVAGVATALVVRRRRGQ